jgi:hypothetical protein
VPYITILGSLLVDRIIFRIAVRELFECAPWRVQSW